MTLSDAFNKHFAELSEIKKEKDSLDSKLRNKINQIDNMIKPFNLKLIICPECRGDGNVSSRGGYGGDEISYYTCGNCKGLKYVTKEIDTKA